MRCCWAPSWRSRSSERRSASARGEDPEPRRAHLVLRGAATSSESRVAVPAAACRSSGSASSAGIVHDGGDWEPRRGRSGATRAASLRGVDDRRFRRFPGTPAQGRTRLPAAGPGRPAPLRRPAPTGRDPAAARAASACPRGPIPLAPERGPAAPRTPAEAGPGGSRTSRSATRRGRPRRGTRRRRASAPRRQLRPVRPRRRSTQPLAGSAVCRGRTGAPARPRARARRSTRRSPRPTAARRRRPARRSPPEGRSPGSSHCRHQAALRLRSTERRARREPRRGRASRRRTRPRPCGPGRGDDRSGTRAGNRRLRQGASRRT